MASQLTAQIIFDQCSDQFSGHHGPMDVVVTGPGVPEDIQAGQILFLGDLQTSPEQLKKWVSAALESSAAVLVVPESMKSHVVSSDKTFLFSSHPRWAMATVIDKLFAHPFMAGGIHPTSVISKKAHIGKDVSIGAYTVIEDGAHIEDRCQIQSHCVIQANARLGAQTQLHPFVVIGKDCTLGKNCLIQSHTVVGSWGFGYAHSVQGHHKHIPHLGTVVLEDNVQVGANCTFDRGTIGDTRIGQGSVIDNRVHLAHNVTLGRHCIVTAGFIAGGSAKIGNHFIAGGRSTVIGHIKVADGVQIGGHSAIHNNLLEPGQYSGHPLQKISDYKKTLVSIRKLDQLRKNVRKLMKEVFKENQ